MKGRELKNVKMKERGKVQDMKRGDEGRSSVGEGEDE